MATSTEPQEMTLRRLVGSKAEVTINDGPYKGQTGTVTSGYGRKAHEGAGAETLCVTIPATAGGKARVIEISMSEVTPVQKPHRPADPSVVAPAHVSPVVT